MPLPLEQVGSGPGCYLWTSTDFMVAIATDGTGQAAVPIPVPYATSLIGGGVFHGWLLPDPGAPQNPLNITTSDALAVTIGL